MSHPRSIAILLSLAVAALAAPRAAYADDAAAVSLYDEGQRLYSAGNYAEACPKFEASLRLDPSSVDTRGRLALCYEKVGRLASAWSAWREVKVRAGRMLGRERAVEIASEHLAELEPKLARLTVQAGARPPAGLSVTLDGASFPIESFGVPVAVDQGKHRLEASAPGHASFATEVTIKDGEKKAVELGPLEKLPEPVATTPPPVAQPAPGVTAAPAYATAPRRQPSSARKWIGITSLGVGVVSLGVGTYFGLDAKKHRDEARIAGCENDLHSCPSSDGAKQADQAWDSAAISTITVIGGAAFTLTGIILWATAPSASDDHERTAWRITPTVGPGATGVAFTGSF